ncbi:hypothetical protein ACR6C2_42685 [Streptomyces sp. INA 01156]
MTENRVQPALRVVLTDVNERVVEAWRAAFADTSGIEIRRGSILDEDVDAWVTRPTPGAGWTAGSMPSSNGTSGRHPAARAAGDPQPIRREPPGGQHGLRPVGGDRPAVPDIDADHGAVLAERE